MKKWNLFPEHCWGRFALFLLIHQTIILRSAQGNEVLFEQISNLTKLNLELSSLNHDYPLNQEFNSFEPPDRGADKAKLDYINERFKNIENIINELKHTYKNGSYLFDRINDLANELTSIKREQDNKLKESEQYQKKLEDTLSNTISMLNNMTERLLKIEWVSQEPKRLQELRRLLQARALANSSRYMNEIQDYYKTMDVIKDVFNDGGDRFNDAEFLLKLNDQVDSLNLRSLLLKHLYDTVIYKSSELPGNVGEKGGLVVTNACYKLQLYDRLVRKSTESPKSLAEENHISLELSKQVKSDMYSDVFVNNLRRQLREYSSPAFKSYQDSLEVSESGFKITGDEDGRKLEEISVSLRNDISLSRSFDTHCWFDISFRIMDRSSIPPSLDFDSIVANFPPFVPISANDMKQSMIDEAMSSTPKNMFKALEKRDYKAALEPYRSIKNDVSQLTSVFYSLSYSIFSKLDVDLIFDFIDNTDNDYNARGILYRALLSAMPRFDSAGILCDLVRLLNRALDYGDLMKEIMDMINTSMKDNISVFPPEENLTVESVAYNQFVVRNMLTNSTLATYDVYPTKYGARSYCYLRKAVDYSGCFGLCTYPFFFRDNIPPLYFGVG